MPCCEKCCEKCCAALRFVGVYTGTRSIQMLYRAVLFTFAPTFIELVFVVGLLASRFSPMVALLVGCTFALYVAWTLSMTQVGYRHTHIHMLRCRQPIIET